ncbi:hypothetical protein IV102_28690 [bacterium]|nr:hypothetical protein [bacterium]
MKVHRFVERIFEPRPKPVDENVSYENAALQTRDLGSIPHDYWSPFGFMGGYTHCPGGVGHGRSIYRDTPVYEPDGKPRVDVTSEHVKAQAYSVPLFAGLGAVGGGGLAYGIGLLVSHFTGLPSQLTAGIAAGVGAAAGGIGLAGYAAGDRVRLEWREFDIREKELVGYYESVSPHYEQRCHTTTDSEGKSKTECESVQNGWNHSFSPDVRYWSVGSYVGPQVVHFQENSGQWTPDARPEDGDKPR